MKYKAPETADTGGGNWLTLPGTYHAVVTHADEHPTKANGDLMDAFRVTVQALEGTVKGEDGKFSERDKTLDLIFWDAKLTDKNEGMFARQKQARFFLATGLMTEEQLGTEIDINLEDAVGRQIVCTLEEQDSQRGDRKFLSLHFADIWHIDDPAAANYPKCDKSIKLIPKALRRDPKSFAKSNGGKKTETSKDVGLDDL
jgi:hypothetical protein